MKRPIEVLTTAEVNEMLLVAGRGLSAIRNRALIVVMWRGGLRVSEALALRPKDLEIERGLIRVLRGKGGKARTVAIDPEACAMVERWINSRRVRLLGDKPGSPLFCTLNGGQIGSSYIRKLLPRLARRAGITKRVHAHALRHLFAVELAREGTPLHIISHALGHANVATTSRYISHIESPELLAAIQGRPSWRKP